MEPVSYAYDAAGERVARWTRSGTADLEADLFVRDEGGSVLAEWRYLDNPSSLATFDLTREYIPGGDRTLGQMDYLGGIDTLRYLAADHLGSTRVLFDAGGILEDYDFYPFGASDDSNPLDPDTTHLFTGHERDTDQYSTEMDYMHARYYSPNLGRFFFCGCNRGHGRVVAVVESVQLCEQQPDCTH